MAFVNVGGVLDDSEKRRLIEGITDPVVEGKGDEGFERYCWVIVDEVEPGLLGVGGQGLTTEDVEQAQVG